MEEEQENLRMSLRLNCIADLQGRDDTAEGSGAHGCRDQHVGWVERSDTQQLKPTPPGVARQLVTFLVLPRKVTQRSRPRFVAPAGFPRSAASKRGCATRPGGAHTPRPTAVLEQCSPKPPPACD